VSVEENVQPADDGGHDVDISIETSYDIDARSVLDESPSRRLVARTHATPQWSRDRCKVASFMTMLACPVAARQQQQ